MKTLTLDCATRTGWATNAGGGVESGYQDFPIPRGASIGTRWIHFRTWLADLLDRTQPDLVIFEQPFVGTMKSGTAAEVAYGMVTRVQEIAESRKIDYRPVHNAVLKRFATGKGNAKKPAMMAAATARFGRTIADDNEADALLMLAWADAGMPEQEPAKKPRQRKAVAA